MAKLTAHDKWRSASYAWRHYEDQAGIRDIIEKELPHIGYYDSVEFDGLSFQLERDREVYRQIVFGVLDLERRRGVIRASRECFRLALEKYYSESNEIHQRIECRGEPIRRKALWGATADGIWGVCGGAIFGEIIWSFFSVTTGSGYLNTRGALIGALAGAVISLLWGFDSILHADRYAVADVARATAELNKTMGTIPDEDFLFYEAEESTGMPSIDPLEEFLSSLETEETTGMHS